jgi:FixJ family two-component response regulator
MHTDAAVFQRQDGLTVLILEDDAAVRDAIAMFVDQLGQEVRCFANAESFFGAGVPKPKDVLIVDIGLPGMDGGKVIEWVNALSEPPQIVAITGQSQTAIREFLDGMPATPLLRKPLSAAELAAHFQPHFDDAGTNKQAHPS